MHGYNHENYILYTSAQVSVRNCAIREGQLKQTEMILVH